PLDLCPAHSEVFQEMVKFECHFTNDTEKVRFVVRHIYNRQQLAVFDSDVGHFVGFTQYGWIQARYFNSIPAKLEHAQNAVNWYCRPNYKVFRPFLEEHRVPPSASQSCPAQSQ
ncbi:HB2J protein, partial [Pycnonotus jocosus]|nr:HB2J protein [Pycnonotus jocosus]